MNDGGGISTKSIEGEYVAQCIVGEGSQMRGHNDDNRAKNGVFISSLRGPKGRHAPVIEDLVEAEGAATGAIPRTCGRSERGPRARRPSGVHLDQRKAPFGREADQPHGSRLGTRQKSNGFVPLPRLRPAVARNCDYLPVPADFETRRVLGRSSAGVAAVYG